MSGRPVGIDVFRRLCLRVGTVQATEPLLGDLASVTVQLDAPIEALAPTSCLPPEIVGRKVVLATRLHPLKVGGRSFTASLIAINGLIPEITSEIPDGSFLE